MLKDTLKNFGKFLMITDEDLALMTPDEQKNFWNKAMIFMMFCAGIGYGICKALSKRRAIKMQKLQEEIDSILQDIESKTKPWGNLDDEE